MNALKMSAKVNHWNITYQHVTHINYNVNIETSTAWTRTIQPGGLSVSWQLVILWVDCIGSK